MLMNKTINKAFSFNSIYAFQGCIFFKENVRIFLQFLGNVTIDVNGKMDFLLYMKNAKSENFIKNLIYCFIHLPFK